jgi:membrane protease YdiL (CAAX protease family)
VKSATKFLFSMLTAILGFVITVVILVGGAALYYGKRAVGENIPFESMLGVFAARMGLVVAILCFVLSWCGYWPRLSRHKNPK